MDKRLKFKCWNKECQREYSLLKRLEAGEQPKLIVECPFCSSQAVVDLAPYRSPVQAVAKDPFSEAAPVAYKFDLPDVLPTAEPEEAHEPE